MVGLGNIPEMLEQVIMEDYLKCSDRSRSLSQGHTTLILQWSIDHQENIF